MYCLLWTVIACIEVLNTILVSGLIRDVALPYQYATSDDWHGTWDIWSSWSSCSRTCGGGVRSRKRSCLVRRMSFRVVQKTCQGETVQYELCGKKECSPYSEDFVTVQCSRHNGLLIAGKRITEWIHHKNGKNPCELQCRAKTEWTTYSFGKMIDGTKCSLPQKGEQAICVNGRCTLIDCTGQLGLDNQRDRCGVCRGNNSTCVQYENTLWSRPRAENGANKDNHYDYNEITVIPSGASHILVRENSENNFLVLVDQDGVYHVNGNWRIDTPGVFSIHDTEFIYNRSSSGYEQLSAAGPTQINFFVFVLGFGNIPTVHYKYWLSQRHTKESYKPLNSPSQINSPVEYLIADQDDKTVNMPTNIIQSGKGYRSYYHRNEILRSVPSWSIKRHRYAYKHNQQLHLNKQYTTRAPVSVDVIENNRPVQYLQNYQKDVKAKHVAEVKSNDRMRIQKATWSSVDRFMRPNISAAQSQGRQRTFTHVADRKQLNEANKEQLSDLEKSDEKLPAKEKRNGRKKRKRKSNGDSCGPCSKVKHQSRNFCLSEFVLRAAVLASETHENSTRYELQVTQSFKNRMPISTREFVWTLNLCKCPRFRIGIEYILMGRSGIVDRRSRESKLLVDEQSFVRRYTQKRARAMQRLVRDQDKVCKGIR